MNLGSPVVAEPRNEEAVVPNNPQPPSLPAADFNLINAAPDLLSVAKVYIQAFDEGKITNTTGHDWTGLIARHARAALSKVQP